MRRAVWAAAFAALAAGCGAPGPAPGVRIDGAYYLVGGAISPVGGPLICYEVKTGTCEFRVPPAVAFYGVDKEYVTVRVRPPGQTEATAYYYIVRLFDGPYPDARAVRGPLTEQEFERVRWRHCVPSEYAAEELKCMPRPTIPAAL
jgi:hypothetical protein